MNTNETIRLNRFLSMAGAASRRKADTYITEGRVTVNGRVVLDLGTKINPASDTIFLDGKQVLVLDEKVYILLNKPKDCITTLSDEKGRNTVMDYVRTSARVFPVGRLDRNTTGVLILTNDGDFAQALMHPKNELKKSYLVTADRPVTDAVIRKLASGVRLDGGMTRRAEVALIPGGKSRVVGITIHEGRNRQIHRMFQSVGYLVDKLERVAYGGITTEGLSRGEWRYLTTREIETLTRQIGVRAEAPEAGGGIPAKKRPGRRAPAGRRSVAAGRIGPREKGTPGSRRQRARTRESGPPGGHTPKPGQRSKRETGPGGGAARKGPPARPRRRGGRRI